MKTRIWDVVAGFIAFISIGIPFGSSAGASERQVSSESTSPQLEVQVISQRSGSHVSMRGYVMARFYDRKSEPSLLELEKACYSQLIRAELTLSNKGSQFDLKSFERSRFQYTPSLTERETINDWPRNYVYFRLTHRVTNEVYKAKAYVSQTIERTREHYNEQPHTRVDFRCSLIGIDITDPSGQSDEIDVYISRHGGRSL